MEYSVGGDIFTVRCSGEIVLSAGAVGTPQVLMRSGVGPQDHLRQIGIDTVVHLPGVGANLQDHAVSAIV